MPDHSLAMAAAPNKIRHFFINILTLSALIFMSAFSVQAQDYTNEIDDDFEAKVEMSLLSDKNAVVAGQSFTLMVKHEIVDHWHTYWKNPGDSGAATKFILELPEGFSHGEVQWPAPQALPYGPLVNFGHEETVRYLVPITAPETIDTETVTLSVDSEWLVCMDICIPEFDKQSLTLPVAKTSQTINKQDFSSALEALPSAPLNPAFSAQIIDKGESLELQIGGQDKQDITSAFFFPETANLIQSSGEQTINQDQNGFTVTILKASATPLEIDTLSGVLQLNRKDGTTQNLYITPSVDIAASSPLQKQQEQESAQTQSDAKATQMALPVSLDEGTPTSLLIALGFAFLGGLILNLMPCVFPVLSMKALSLVKLNDGERGKALLHGLSYTFGVVLSFLVIAMILIGLQEIGSGVGWGFQLQNPLVSGALTYLLFLIGLNLSGYFEFAGGFTNAGQSLTRAQGFSGSFFTGALATLVATPCTAPFMAGALGYALVQPPEIALSIFAALGFGLAFPYLLLTAIPPLQKILPRPGAWMDVFRQFLAFPMFGSALWLLWVYTQQTGADAALYMITGAATLTFAVWLFKTLPGNPLMRGILVLLAWIMVGLSIYAIYAPTKTEIAETVEQAQATTQETGEITAVAYSPKALEDALATDRPVLVNMTAAWCITCLANERVALSTEPTKQLFADMNMIYIKGDWTNRNAEIKKYLNRYGRNGVPIYVFYGAPDSETGERPKEKILPQLLNNDIVRNAITAE